MTHVKIMANLFTSNGKSHGTDFEYLANMNDILGDDATIQPTRRTSSSGPEDWEENYTYQWREMMAYDFMHSVSPGKAHVNSENHFITGNTFEPLEVMLLRVEYK